MSDFSLPGVHDNNLGDFCLGAWMKMIWCDVFFQQSKQSKFEKFPQPVGYIGLSENQIKILEIKPLGVYRNMGRFILEVNPKGLVR